MKKRGVSGIIIISSLILIALASAVITWNVVKSVIEKSGESVLMGQLMINLEVSSVYISEDDLAAYVSVARGAGDGEISALDFIFTGSSYIYRYPLESGIPSQLEGKVYNITAYAMRLQNPDFDNFSSIKSVSIAFEVVSYGKTITTPVKSEFKGELRSDTSLPSKINAPVYEGGAGCTDGEIIQCGVTDVGPCQFGNKTCTVGVWGSCVGNIDPVAETIASGNCGDLTDNDCDTLTDSSDPACGGSCAGTDISCGTTTCANCNLNDTCVGTSYRNYYCSGTSCIYTTNNCNTTCTCQCGGYGVIESGGYCTDGLDNDCNTEIDCGGSCITGTETEFCVDGIDNDKDCLLNCADPDCFSDPACAGGTRKTIMFDNFETNFTDPWYDDGIPYAWTRDSNGTPTTNTGPCGGVASCSYPAGAPNGDGVNTTWYIFVETSSGSCYSAGNTSIVYQKPAINFNSYTGEQISWWSNMYGSNIGNLSLQENTTGSWNTLWSKSGNQGTTWFQSSVNLSSLTGTGNLRFYYACAGGLTGDAAIDEINITGIS